MNSSHAKSAIILALVLFSFLDANAASSPTQPLPGSKPTPAASVIVPETALGAEMDMSVMKRFQSYSGPRTPAAMSVLFSMPLSNNIRQYPEIALSDGVTPVTIEFTVPGQGGAAPNFACNGARLISITRSEAGTWVIATLPDKGSWMVSLIILTGSASLEVPLAVAPSLPAGTDLSEQGFITYLSAKQGPDPQQVQDLNGDGKGDYLDDYIFTANYLINQRSTTSIPDVSLPTDSQNPQNSNAVPSETPGAGPGIDPGSSSAFKPETSPDKRDPASRNERARKMKELLKRPTQ